MVSKEMPFGMKTAEIPAPSARAAANVLRRARRSAGLSLRVAARRALTSHPALVAYETGRKAPSVGTFLRLLEAYGYAADIELSPRIRQRDGYPRGRELEDVLELAEQFPARPVRRLDSPRFGAR
jgi:transcriptional regulator with XRE-family HTH domain